MNPLKFSESISAGGRKVRVWDNAAFDDDLLHRSSVDSSGRFEGKENRPQGQGLKRFMEASSVDGNGGGIDEEIMEVEQEIKRLTLRLHMLRAKKMKRAGRVVPAKFMPPRTPAAKNLPTPATTPGVQGKSSVAATPKPMASESMAGVKRRGMSLGPWETASLSRVGIATAEVMKSGERVGAAIRPKALFQEEDGGGEERRQGGRNSSARARIVPSRYSIVVVPRAGDEPGSKRRKWSLPEQGKKEKAAAAGKGKGGGGGRRESIAVEALPQIRAPLRRRTMIDSPREFAGKNPFLCSGRSLKF